jgi:hypothetical protein
MDSSPERSNQFLNFTDRIGRRSVAEAFPPTDDGQANRAVGFFIAEKNVPIIGLIADGWRFHVGEQAQVKHVGEDVVVVRYGSVDDSFDGIGRDAHNESRRPTRLPVLLFHHFAPHDGQGIFRCSQPFLAAAIEFGFAEFFTLGEELGLRLIFEFNCIELFLVAVFMVSRPGG